MDISNWPPKKVMQLPDHFFGDRWWISIPERVNAGVVNYYMSPLKLPNHTVIWELHIARTYASVSRDVFFGLRLGNRLPTTAAQFASFPLLMPSYSPRRQLNEFFPTFHRNTEFLNLRYYVHAKGRNLIASSWNQATTNVDFHIGLLVSALPTSIPDELLTPRLEHVEQRLDEIWKRIKL